ncbi:hypothetical protein [Mucilaginibacter sp. UYCu711]|uniref:hypothetical protein n=1 Tax=Mucilaginibacter sp. UYCu711 TaxID=3156339 RepID=UPI003D1ABA29
MKQPVIEGVNIMPQLEITLGLDMHKDKIVGFNSCKDRTQKQPTRKNLQQARKYFSST